MDGRVAPQPEAAPELAPIGRILVGFDERPAARDALALARCVAARTGAELTVASIRPYWPELIGSEEYARVLAADEAWIQRAAAKTLGGRAFKSHAVGGTQASEGLKGIALATGADLIVVGSTHRGALGRVLPGSVGERVLDNAPCAVAIAPRGLSERESEPELSTIAVGYDGSRQAAVALELGTELAAAEGARLRILGAVDVRLDTAGLPHSPDEIELARMRGALERAAASVPSGIEAEPRLLHGAPHYTLLEEAREADLLLLGSRGHYGRSRRLFLGSVAARVMREAPCPTLVTPAA